MNIVLLAAGYGTRIRSIFPNIPKALIEVSGKPILGHLVDNVLRLKSITKIIIVTNNLYFNLITQFVKSQDWDQPIQIINDGSSNPEKRLGAIGDLALSLNQINITKDLLVLATDKLLEFDLRPAIELSKIKQAPVNLCMEVVDHKSIAGKHGCILLNKKNRIIDFAEKPYSPKSLIASLAVSILTSTVLDEIPIYLESGGKIDAPGYFMSWLSKRTAVYGYIVPGKVYDVGTPETFDEAVKSFRPINNQ